MHTAITSSAEPWRVDPLSTLVSALQRLRRRGSGEPTVVAIDGRSGSGKSTLARRLANSGPATVSVVETDDIAWNESFFDWAAIARSGLLDPIRQRGTPVTFRPPAWERHGRPGAITVPNKAGLILIAGVGSSRLAFADVLDGSVWIDLDEPTSTQRVASRGGSDGQPEDPAFVAAWASAERAFLDRDRPWERASVIVDGRSSRNGGPVVYRMRD
ncbi:hypothetical protein [Rhodococcus sp. UNC23MFCrub1.1]|uniref:hypothetical protein n=1 Tax=Rhodococcus sp. UNC23MFCrub1.1 TaxID=1449068 RepID=UPI0006921354|nr:hypothetical protein [Rhodococcus sp. UNC23MFCrub1.1]